MSRTIRRYRPAGPLGLNAYGLTTNLSRHAVLGHESRVNDTNNPKSIPRCTSQEEPALCVPHLHEQVSTSKTSRRASKRSGTASYPFRPGTYQSLLLVQEYSKYANEARSLFYHDSHFFFKRRGWWVREAVGRWMCGA